MGVGQIISGTFGMVKERFGSLLGLWAVYFGLTIVFSIVFFMTIGAVGLAGFASLAGGETLSDGGAAALGGGLLVTFILFYLAYILIAMAQYASLISMASPTERPSFGDALGAGWRAAPALLLLMVVLIVAYIALALVFSLLGAALAALGDAGSVILAIVLVPVLVWIGCRLNPLIAVVAVDRVRNPFTAIGRAWRLTRGHALTIFLASLVFIVILVVVCGIALLPSLGMLRSMADPAAVGPDAVGQAFGGIALFGLSMLVVSALFNLLYCAFMAVVHGALTSAAGEGTAVAFE